MSLAEQVKLERDGYRHIISSAGEVEPVHRTETMIVPLGSGEIPLKVYYPSDSSRLPALVYYHGGGFVAGGFDTHEQQLCFLCNHAGVVIVAVGYRLAPEHPYPAAIEDGYNALLWVVSHTRELGIDEERISIGGDSSGGLISAEVALKARGAVPVRFQLLFDPNMDLTRESKSWRELGDRGYVLTSKKMELYLGWYLPRDTDRRDPAVSPLFAADFSGLPATFIIAGSADPLKDEDREYAERLGKAGVKVEYREYQGVMHGFYQQSGVLDAGKKALAEAAAALAAGVDFIDKQLLSVWLSGGKPVIFSS